MLNAGVGDRLGPTLERLDSSSSKTGVEGRVSATAGVIRHLVAAVLRMDGGGARMISNGMRNGVVARERN